MDDDDDDEQAVDANDCVIFRALWALFMWEEIINKEARKMTTKMGQNNTLPSTTK